MFAVFRNPRKSLTASVLAAAVMALSACQTATIGGSSGPRLNARGPVKVALLVPRGSNQPSDAILARALENATRMAISDLEGVSIELKVYNTGATASGASTATSEALNDGAKVILGPLYAQAANAAGVVAAQRGVNVLSFSNNTAIAGGNVFVLGNTFDNTADRLVRYAARKGRGRIMVAHDRTVAGEAGRDAILKAIANSPATSAGVVSYEFSQNGVINAVPSISAKARANRARSVFMTADTSGTLPLLSQLLPENGLDNETTQFIGLTRWDIPNNTLALPGVQGGWFALPDPQRTKQFNARYSTAYGQGAHPLAAIAYDGVAAIGALIKTGRRDALTTESLVQNPGFSGVNGVFRLKGDGTNQRALAVAEIRDGKVVIVDAAPKGFGGAGS